MDFLIAGFFAYLTIPVVADGIPSDFNTRRIPIDAASKIRKWKIV